MVFQEPMVSLNPAMPIGRQMAEALKLHLRFLDDAEDPAAAAPGDAGVGSASLDR